MSFMMMKCFVLHVKVVTETFGVLFFARFSHHADLYVRGLKCVRIHRSVMLWFWFCFFPLWLSQSLQLSNISVQ